MESEDKRRRFIILSKKWFLVLLTIVPIPVGYLINLLVANYMDSFVGRFSYYILPLLELVFWFWLGFRFSRTTWCFGQSMLIGSMSGILSFVLYMWQFWRCSDAERNMFLAGLSQCYLCSTPMYLFLKISSLFDSDPNTIDQYDKLYLYIISVVIMTAIFALGYWWEKKKQKE